MEDFLKDRYQKVRFNKYLSERLEIQEGVPQGSKLGPLFLLFVNDLPKILKK